MNSHTPAPLPSSSSTESAQSRPGHVYRISKQQVAEFLGCERDQAMKKLWQARDERLRAMSN